MASEEQESEWDSSESSDSELDAAGISTASVKARHGSTVRRPSATESMSHAFREHLRRVDVSPDDLPPPSRVATAGTPATVAPPPPPPAAVAAAMAAATPATKKSQPPPPPPPLVIPPTVGDAASRDGVDMRRVHVVADPSPLVPGQLFTTPAVTVGSKVDRWHDTRGGSRASNSNNVSPPPPSSSKAYSSLRERLNVKTPAWLNKYPPPR